MKRFFTAFLAFLLVICLAACGKATKESALSNGDSSATPTETTAPVDLAPGHDQLMLYIKDDGIYLLDCRTNASQLIYTHPDAWTAAMLCDSRNSAAGISDDGAVVYWLMGNVSGEDTQPDLYVYTAGGETKQVAQGVQDFRISGDGQYCVYVNGAQQIYHYSLTAGTSVLIAARCQNTFSMDTWFFAVGGCPDSFLYQLDNYVYFSDGLGLYRVAFGGSRQKIADRAWELDRHYIADNKLVVYVEYIKDQPLGAVYTWQDGQSTKVLDSASQILQVYPDGSFYYVDGGGLSDLSAKLCYYDGVSSTQLCEYTGRFDFCFSTSRHGGILFAYETDQVFLVRGGTVTQWSESYVNRTYAANDKVWFSSASGVYSFDLATQAQPVLELKDCKIYYQDKPGRVICSSWQDEVYVDGAPAGKQSSSDSLFYRNDYLVTFETDHTLVGFAQTGAGKHGLTSYKNAYNLFLFGTEPVEIAQNTVVHFGMENGTLVYLKDMDPSTFSGSLYLHQTGRDVLIDSNVYGIVPCTK